jgi:hypothetical protein
MRRILIATLVTLTLAIVPVATFAADPMNDIGFRGWGPRLGVTINPDQFHVGAHLDFGNFAQHVRFQPNVEVGFGDNVTLVTANADAAYRFSSKWDVWTPYLGGGLGLVFASVGDKGVIRHNTSTDLGANILGGIDKGLANGDRFFIEAKLGLVDHSPDAMASVGWTFYH